MKNSMSTRAVDTSILYIVMQPHDYVQNGEQDECDGCPNKTYWNGRLVSECRKEDYMLYGRPIITVERKADRMAFKCG